MTRTRFDGWALVREWGRIGQPGTVRETGYETEGTATAAALKNIRQKEKRGYIPCAQRRAGIVETRRMAGARFIPRRECRPDAAKAGAKGWVRGKVTAANREAEA